MPTYALYHGSVYFLCKTKMVDGCFVDFRHPLLGCGLFAHIDSPSGPQNILPLSGYDCGWVGECLCDVCMPVGCIFTCDVCMLVGCIFACKGKGKKVKDSYFNWGGLKPGGYSRRPVIMYTYSTHTNTQTASYTIRRSV